MKCYFRVFLLTAATLLWVGSSDVSAQEEDGSGTESVEGDETGGDQASDLPSSERHDRMDIITIDRVWTAARRRGDRESEMAADVRLNQWLADELAEADAHATDAIDEAQAHSEEAEEIGRLREGHAARDDYRDARAEVRDDAQLHSIARELQELQPAFTEGEATPLQYREKRRLLNELVRLAGRDVREERREDVEDFHHEHRLRR
jgi:hypothetical protein